jgi:hypothetical protein
MTWLLQMGVSCADQSNIRRGTRRHRAGGAEMETMIGNLGVQARPRPSKMIAAALRGSRADNPPEWWWKASALVC